MQERERSIQTNKAWRCQKFATSRWHLFKHSKSERNIYQWSSRIKDKRIFAMLLHSVFYCWIMDRGRCRVFSPTCEECSANAWCHRQHCFKNKWQNGALLHLFSSNLVKTLESLPLLEMRINSCDEKPIKWCLDAFLKDEKEWYGYNVSTIPLNFTCNMSWPITKTPLRIFNNESIEEYCQRSYTIATGNATSKELHPKPLFTFISHMS